MCPYTEPLQLDKTHQEWSQTGHEHPPKCFLSLSKISLTFLRSVLLSLILQRKQITFTKNFIAYDLIERNGICFLLVLCKYVMYDNTFTRLQFPKCERILSFCLFYSVL